MLDKLMLALILTLALLLCVNAIHTVLAWLVVPIELARIITYIALVIYTLICIGINK